MADCLWRLEEALSHELVGVIDGPLAAGGHDWLFHDKSLPFITPRSHVTQRLASSRPFSHRVTATMPANSTPPANYAVGWSHVSGFDL